MIRASYIHENDLFDDVYETIAMSEAEVASMISAYESKCDAIRTRNYIESVHEDSEYFTEGAKEIVEKVGKAVEAMIGKVIELIKTVSDRVKQILWDSKSDIEKEKVILQKYPEHKDDIIMAIKQGDIDIKDIKSMDDLIHGSYDLLGRLNSGKVDASGFEKAFNAINDKWERYGKPIAGMVTTTTGVLTAIVAIHEFFPKLAKAKIDNAKYKGELVKMQEESKNICKNRPDDSFIGTAVQKVIGNVCSKLTKNLQNYNGLFGRVRKAIDGWIKSNQTRSANRKENAKELSDWVINNLDSHKKDDNSKSNGNNPTP